MKLSPALPTGEFTAANSTTIITLGHSGFNPVWLAELGIHEPMIILDIGAYDAGDAIRLKQHFPGAEIAAFEADPYRYERIIQYAQSFGINLHRVAVTDKTGSTPFYPAICNTKDAGDTHYPGEHGGQGSLYRHNYNYRSTYPQIKQLDKPVIVPCITISDFCELARIGDTEIALMHIDVEGAEYAVINGMGEIRPKVIYLETLGDMFEGVPAANELHKLLTEKDYTLVADLGSEKLYRYNQN